MPKRVEPLGARGAQAAASPQHVPPQDSPPLGCSPETSPMPSAYPALVSDAPTRKAITRWLLALALTDGLDEPASRPPVLPFPGDARAWLDLPCLAEGHGLAALIDGRLGAGAPASIAAGLAAAAARSRARHLRLEADIARIESAFMEAGLAFLPLKGSALIDRCYALPDCRPRADIDVLLPEPDRPLAERSMRGLGYSLLARSWKHRIWIQPSNVRVLDLRGEHPDNPRPVEMHPRAVEAFRGIELDLSGAILRQPEALAPLAAHLCAHLTVDLLGRRLRLIQLVDLHRLLPRLSESDWREFERLARGHDRARYFLPALALLARETDWIPPAGLLEALESETKPALRNWLEAQDLDALGYFGRQRAARSLLEVPRIWPRGPGEQLRLWRYILWPGRWELADRYPRMAAALCWPLIYPRHLIYSVRLLVGRFGLALHRALRRARS